VYHLYVLRITDRDGLMRHLKDAGIGSAIHYPVPLHMQRAYLSLNYSIGEFPVTESAAAEIVSLPMYPQLILPQQEKVAAEVVKFATKTTIPDQAGTLVAADRSA
jgi:dTDP-4-amino-4,6-dideoxygalactose transaminase